MPRTVPLRHAGGKQLERKAKAAFRRKNGWGILRVTLDGRPNFKGRDGVSPDFYREKSGYVILATKPKIFSVKFWVDIDTR